jgi:hypothetical protein
VPYAHGTHSVPGNRPSRRALRVLATDSTASAMRRDPRQGKEGASTWESGLATQVTTRVALRYR